MKSERAGVLHEKVTDKSQETRKTEHLAPIKGAKSAFDS